MGVGGTEEFICVASAPGVAAGVGAGDGTADGLLVGEGIGEVVASAEGVLRTSPSSTTAA